MNITSLERRLRRIEAMRARQASGPRLAKAERDALAASELLRPGGMAASLAALASQPNAAIRERSRAVVEAFWRADT